MTDPNATAHTAHTDTTASTDKTDSTPAAAAHAHAQPPAQTEPRPPSGRLPYMQTDLLVARICDGSIQTFELTGDERRRCVEHLIEQGLTHTEIASILRVCKRTITRDRKTLRRRAAVRPDPKLGDELLGEFEQLTQNTIARLTRLARDPEAPHMVRWRAERDLLTAYRQYIELAQRLAYIETGARRLRDQRLRDPKASTPLEREMQRIAGMVGGAEVGGG